MSASTSAENVPGDRVHVLGGNVVIAVLVEVIVATAVLIDAVVPDLYRVWMGVLRGIVVVAVPALTESGSQREPGTIVA